MSKKQKQIVEIVPVVPLTKPINGTRCCHEVGLSPAGKKITCPRKAFVVMGDKPYCREHFCM